MEERTSIAESLNFTPSGQILKRNTTIDAGMRKKVENNRSEILASAKFKRAKAIPADKSFIAQLKIKTRLQFAFSMLIMSIFLTHLVLLRSFENGNNIDGGIASGVTTFLLLSIYFIQRRLVSRTSYAINQVFFLLPLCGIIMLSNAQSHQIIFIYSFILVLLKHMQSSDKSMNSLVASYFMIASLYLIKVSAITTDCFVPGYCPTYEMPKMKHEVFWLIIGVLALATVAFFDKVEKVIVTEIIITKEELVEIRAKAELGKPQIIIAAPLTRASQLLFQCHRKYLNDPLVNDSIRQILEILQSDDIYLIKS